MGRRDSSGQMKFCCVDRFEARGSVMVELRRKGRRTAVLLYYTALMAFDRIDCVCLYCLYYCKAQHKHHGITCKHQGIHVNGNYIQNIFCWTKILTGLISPLLTSLHTKHINTDQP